MVYPTLARMAYELYSIPSMSAEVEGGVFSRFYLEKHELTHVAPKLTLRDRRNRLSTESVESVKCLHHWLLSGLIEGVLDRMDVENLMMTWQD